MRQFLSGDRAAQIRLLTMLKDPLFGFLYRFCRNPVIAEDARSKVVLVPGVTEADVRIVWEPPWNQAMISEEGKMELGLV